MEAQSGNICAHRGLRVCLVGVIREFHLGEQVLPVLLETTYEAWGVRAARLPLRRHYYYITFDHESSVVDIDHTMAAIQVSEAPRVGRGLGGRSQHDCGARSP